MRANRIGECIPAAIPSIPDIETLRGLQQECPSYKYLVNYLCLSPLQVASKLRHFGTERPALLRAIPARRPDRQFVLAWLLMDNANDLAKRDSGVRHSLVAISRRWGVAEDELLRCSFIPREVLGLLEIKRSLSIERKLEARDVRQLRQLQARRPETYGEIPILRGRGLGDHEHRRWAENFGLDKDSADFTRQRIWGQMEVGLCELIRQPVIEAGMRWRAGAHDGAPPEATSWRAASRDVSRLLRARYPDLWPDRPGRLRSRYDYKPSLRQKTS